MLSAPDRIAQRECPICLASVLRCAHFEGQLLVLSPTPDEASHRPPCSINLCEYPFHVNNAADRHVPCATCGVPNRIEVTKYTCHDTLPAAEREFDRREAELLGHA